MKGVRDRMALPMPVAPPPPVTNTPYQVRPLCFWIDERNSWRSSPPLLQLVPRSISLNEMMSGFVFKADAISRSTFQTPSVPQPPWCVLYCSTRRVDGDTGGSVVAEPYTTVSTGQRAGVASLPDANVRIELSLAAPV